MPTRVVDPQHLRRVVGAFPTGVAAVAAVVDGEPVVLAANSFTSVSLDPPLVSVCVAHTSTTWPVLGRATRLGISVLAADQDGLGRQFSARGVDRFAGVQWRRTDDGAVLVEHAAAWLETSIWAQHRAGDHDIVVLEVHDLDAQHEVGPLVFHASRFGRLG